ncbi:MAG: hypothetical protein JWP29_188 [Rhodoferax sp.]|nr:hypothetical protein [Rhodoferax sp.]
MEGKGWSVVWTSPLELRAQVQRLWDQGVLLAEGVHGRSSFPRRLRLVTPSSGELSDRFDEARKWAEELRRNAQHYRLEERNVRHRVLGNNAVPDAAWVDSLDAALALIGKTKEARHFAAQIDATRQRQPLLLPWLERRPMTALALADAWDRLLAVVAWLQAHPRPGIYLRQVDIAGVDSKFIETQRSVLSELLDLALPTEAIDTTATGASPFARRYGFTDKPLRIRFRLLGEPGAYGRDIAITQSAFEALRLPVRRVFFTENEINFLAFPEVRDAMVIFGSGYGFEVLAQAAWLRDCHVFYWGDIDTHGFAILDQLRSVLPHAESLLMDRATLLAHADHWGEEPTPVLRDLPRLTHAERALFDDLRDNRYQAGLRLEQERLAFGWVEATLAALPSDACPT